jgi:hypothetical protein
MVWGDEAATSDCPEEGFGTGPVDKAMTDCPEEGFGTGAVDDAATDCPEEGLETGPVDEQHIRETKSCMLDAERR